MAITHSEIKSNIRDALNKGTTYDTLIDSRIVNAVNWIERVHSFLYMERFFSGTFNKDATDPKVLQLPTLAGGRAGGLRM